MRYLSPHIDIYGDKFSYKGLNLAWLNKASSQKYEKTKQILYMHFYSGRID